MMDCLFNLDLCRYIQTSRLNDYDRFRTDGINVRTTYIDGLEFKTVNQV